MNRSSIVRISLGILAVLALPGTLTAGTNGFVVPNIRGAAGAEFGYWESFTVPTGLPGNRPDQPGASTAATLIQSTPSAIIAGSGNLYNPGGNSSFSLTNATASAAGTVILQIRTSGSELDYPSVALTYSDAAGPHSLAPLFRYELSRIAIPGQGASVSSLWQWNLAGITAGSYGISFNASGPSLSLDSITLDTAPAGTTLNGNAAFLQQPFKVQSATANVARWMYSFNANPASRPTASVFGALGSSPDFDSRDAQFLLGWTTTNQVPAGQGAKNYLIRRARVTLTIASGNQYAYTGILRDYRSYFPTNDPRYLPASTSSYPVELFGAGFRGSFTNASNAVVPYAATNYPQDGPWASDPNGGFHENRVAYAASFNTNGQLADASNNVGDDSTNEITAPFEIAPFAVGKAADVAEGQLMPLGSQLAFDLNLEDPLIYSYVQRGLNDGNLSFVAASLIGASFSGPPNYPNFYTSFSPIATAGQYPSLDIEGAVVRTNVDSDGDGLPDDWENFYFGSLANDAASSFANDGISNLGKYLAGTDPNTSASNFRLLSVQQGQNIAELQFTFAPNRQYGIWWSDDLKNWQAITNPPLTYSSAWLSKRGTNLTYPSPVYATWQETNTASQKRFYRVGAQ